MRFSRTTVFINTVIAAVLVKPKSSLMVSKFFLRAVTKVQNLLGIVANQCRNRLFQEKVIYPSVLSIAQEL